MNIFRDLNCISRALTLLIIVNFLSAVVAPGESARHNGNSSVQETLLSKFAVRFLDRRNRMIQRRIVSREELKPKVCFELLGCFADPPPALSLKRPPEHPSVIQTQFFLYTRKKRHEPEVINYGDSFKSIANSQFDATKKLKVIIHGFKGSGSDAGGIAGAHTILDLEDANVIILDWTRGAGTTYKAAVSNTELVGRQLALILLDVINLGTNPRDIHVIGFSLGAHVAGCASEVLKKKKFLLGRITGLDPASPFFRHHVLRERSRKLDVTDARLVDIIHTDGADDFTDGFGLLKPMGHVDFFPNGGREQPGCNDIKNVVVYSHFHEDILDRKIACSHARAWDTFLESVQSQTSECKFIAWPCSQGFDSFARGTCFPKESSKWTKEMGYGADRGSPGIYYLATRDQSPFCGDPVRAAVTTSVNSQRTSGSIFLRIKHPNSTTTFRIRCEIGRLSDRREERLIFYHIAAAEFKSMNENVDKIEGSIFYQVDKEDPEEGPANIVPRAKILQIDDIYIENRKGNRWQHCGPKITLDQLEQNVFFHNKACPAN